MVDLHLHSCFSDGTCTPEELAQAVKEHGVTLAALADHNTSAGTARFQAACESLAIQTIRGMEMDCLYNGLVLHVLAYGFEATGKVMSFAAHSKQLLLEMSRDLIKKMHKDYPQLTLEEYDHFSYDPQKGGWNGLHYLLEKGVTQTLEGGMGLYSKYGCDYSSYPFPSVGAVCESIRDAGGVPVLAHPGNWFSDTPPKELTGHLDELRRLGIGGIECYYPSHSSRLTAFCLEYCSRNDLLVTAGSDAHGQFAQQLHGVDYHIGSIEIALEQLRLGRLYHPHTNLA